MHGSSEKPKARFVITPQGLYVNHQPTSKVKKTQIVRPPDRKPYVRSQIKIQDFGQVPVLYFGGPIMDGDEKVEWPPQVWRISNWVLGGKNITEPVEVKYVSVDTVPVLVLSKMNDPTLRSNVSLPIVRNGEVVFPEQRWGK